MAFSRPKRRQYSEDELYEYAVGALGRRMRTVAELKTRGVHGSVIEKAVEETYEGVSDEKQAREFLRKKRLQKPRDQKETARVFRQLARAGFGMKTIFTILKKWDVDDEILGTLESETA